jgi:membrane-bound metal-dependent hydrolase YbcI (DUF457 family)
MIAGHFGFAALVKSRERCVPLWALMLATVWLDIVFVPLFIARIETLEPVAGLRGGYGASLIHADYTHSLLGALALSALFGVAFAARWGRRCGIVLTLVSFSHWLLDLVVHRPDLPLLPGNLGGLPKLGFGVWQMPAVSIAIELLLVSAGAWFYWYAARSVSESAHSSQTRATVAGMLVLICGITVLVLDVTEIVG